MPSDAMGFKGTTFLTYPSATSAAGDRVTLTAHPHRVLVTPSYFSSRDNTPGPIPTRLTPVVGTWSPSLSRKIRWRVRQSSLWQKIVSCAFVLATVVFFSALAGIGDAPGEPDQLASGWHAPGLGRFGRDMTSQPSLLRFTGLWKKRTAMDVQDDEDAEAFLEMKLPRFVRKRPRYGTSQKEWRSAGVNDNVGVLPSHYDDGTEARSTGQGIPAK